LLLFTGRSSSAHRGDHPRPPSTLLCHDHGLLTLYTTSAQGLCQKCARPVLPTNAGGGKKPPPPSSRRQPTQLLYTYPSLFQPPMRPRHAPHCTGTINHSHHTPPTPHSHVPDGGARDSGGLGRRTRMPVLRGAFALGRPFPQ
jgi:hypothetical protein